MTVLRVTKSRWFDRWHVYDIDTGGKVWLATFRRYADAADWISNYYADHQ
jgi:hypothetical protein